MRLHAHLRHQLRSGDFEAEIAPAAGGRLARLWARRDGIVQDLIVALPLDDFDEDQWPKAGAFPMLPYANRLRHGRIIWNGQSHQVRRAPGQSHGVHGFAHRRAWQVATCSGHHIDLTLRHVHSDAEWPWQFTAYLRYRLHPGGLSLEMEVRNDADGPMPLVMGWHPYFAPAWRTRERPALRGLHDLGPDGLHYPNDDVPRARPSQEQPGFTMACEQVAGAWTLWDEAGRQLRIECDAAHCIHHRPGLLDSECVEPVTALPGALASDRNDPTLDLAPGTSRLLRYDLFMR